MTTINNRSSLLDLPLPHAGNTLVVDVDRLVSAFEALDGFARAHFENMAYGSGYSLVAGSFEAGGVLSEYTHVLYSAAHHKIFRWDGASPLKTVPMASSPETTGGINPGAWMDATNVAPHGDMPCSQQTGTSYGLQITDRGTMVEMDNASANSVVVPTYASVPFDVGTRIGVRQIGSGRTDIASAAGVTLLDPNGLLAVRARYDHIMLHHRAINVWVVDGTYDAQPASVAAQQAAADAIAAANTATTQASAALASADAATAAVTDTQTALATMAISLISVETALITHMALE